MTSSDTEEYDDLSDLDTMEMDSVREWEMQFKGKLFISFGFSFFRSKANHVFHSNFVFAEKYEYVGRLLRPGEEPSSYSDEEDENPIESSTDSSKNSNKDDIKDIDSTSGDKPKSEWPKQRKSITELMNGSSCSTNIIIASKKYS